MTKKELENRVNRIANENLSAVELKQEIADLTSAHISAMDEVRRVEAAVKEKYGDKALQDLLNRETEKGDELAYD